VHLKVSTPLAVRGQQFSEFLIVVSAAWARLAYLLLLLPRLLKWDGRNGTQATEI